MVISRRELLAGLSAAVVPSSLGSDVVSAFRRTVQPAASSMRFGYAAITWATNLRQAIDDISAVGFRGIQPRIDAFQQFGDKPAALKELLQERKLAFAVMSSGNLSIDPAREASELATHLRHAQFVRDAGGQYLQVIDERPKGREIVADDYRRLGRLLTTLGRRTADIGVPLVYHHHMNSLGEKPNEVAAVLEAADRGHVNLLFDVAHYQQAGGDPASAIRRYGQWIKVVHLKDVRSRGSSGSRGSDGSSGSRGTDGSRGLAAPKLGANQAGEGGSGQAATGYEFVELGRGRVDLPAVFASLAAVKFNGWAIVELDRVPEPGRTPKEAAEMNKRYLIEQAHQTI